MMIRFFALLLTVGLVASAQAAPKKYHFDLAAVNAKPEVKPEFVKAATPRVEGQVKKAFESHPQLVGKLDGAPDWKTATEAFRKYLAKKGLAGAYHVTVDITEASEELEPMEGSKSQRLVVRVAIHMLGETMPGRTMGFTGDGRATIKQEIARGKVKDRDREFTWDAAAEAAIADAMKTVFKQLALPQKKQ